MSLIEMGELMGLGAHLKEHTINFIWEKLTRQQDTETGISCKHRLT